MTKQDKLKLVAAVVFLLLAALLLAWNFGLFERAGSAGPSAPPGPAAEPPPPPPTTPGGQPSAG